MTKFEHLPNELILIIFTYLSPEDLFIKFFKLNTRLNALLYAQSLHINLGDSLPKYLLDIYYKSILSHACNQIHSLKLSDTYGRMSHFLSNDNQQIEIDFDTRLFILSQVKFLTICDPKQTSLDRILQYTNDIEYLYISMIQRNEYTTDHVQRLFKPLFKMKSLKQLHIKMFYAMAIDDDLDTSISLTNMILFSCYIQDLPKFLRRMPNIQKLHIRCYSHLDSSIVDDDKLDYSLYDNLTDYIPYLTDLKLKILFVPFEKVEVLLRQLPQLIKLTFSSLTMEHYSYGFNLERIIINYLPNLQKFSLFIDASYIFEDIHIDLNEIIQSFNSLFWHRWPVAIEYYAETIDNRRLKLYTLPIQEEYLRTYLYGLQIRMNNDEYNINTEKSYYKKLDELEFIFHDNLSSRNLLEKRVYSNLTSLSFSFELTNIISYETDAILNDFQQVFSTSVLSKIEKLHLYDRIYPINFISKLLNLLPNIDTFGIRASSLNISISLPLVKVLTIDFNSTIEYYSTNVLRQIGTYFPNLTVLSFESVNTYDIYILISYCLRKLSYLAFLNVIFNQTSPRLDQQLFILWFNDYKQLNGLSNDVQVEFSDDEGDFQITL